MFSYRIQKKSKPLALALLLLPVPVLFVFRVLGTGYWLGSFLVWNTLLAILPLILAYWARQAFRQKGSSKAAAWLLTGLWLLFFPNAAYIITDLIHLSGQFSGHLLWFDSLFVFYAAFCGLVTGLLSLHIIHQLLVTIFSKTRAWMLIGLAALLSGYGIYLGRVLRFNSWDLFTEPLKTISSILTNLANGHALQFAAFYGVVQFIIYLAFCLLITQDNEYRKNASQLQLRGQGLR